MKIDSARLASLGRASPTILIFGGNIGRSVVGIVISMLVARILGPGDFGLYYFFIVTAMIGQVIFGEVVDGAAIRYLAHYRIHEPDLVHRVIGSAVVLRLIISVPLVLVVAFSSGWIAESLYGDGAYVSVLHSGLICGLAAGWFNLTLSIHAAHEEFVRRAVLPVVVNVARLAVGLVLLSLGLFAVDTVIWGETAAWVVVWVVTLWPLREELRAARFNCQQLSQLFHFAKWSLLGHSSNLLLMTAAVPTLGYFWDSEAAGIYAAAMTLTIAFEHVTGAIFIVQFPAASKLKRMDEIRRYMKEKALRYVLTAAAFLPGILLAEPAVTLVYGASYVESVAIFQILYVGVMVNIIATPIGLVLIALNRPELFSLAAFLGFLSWAAMAVVLIPDAAAVGAAQTTLVARIVFATLIFAFLWTAMRSSATGASGVDDQLTPP